MSGTAEANLVKRLSRSVAIGLSRRDLIHQGFRLAGGALFMFLLGRSGSVAAFADESACDPCQFPFGKKCTACPDLGCPESCSICKLDEGAFCIYPSGYWTVNCGDNLVARCYDCKCGDNYEDTCGCQSKSYDPSIGMGGGGACGGQPCNDKGG